MNPAAERIGTLVLAAILQVCSAAGERGAAAQPAADQATDDRIVATVEVLEKVRAARQNDTRTFGGDVNVPGLLPQVSDYPTMTVSIDPADPADFVVTINNTRYPSGARAFRVVPGTASIVVTRRGKEPCKATLEVTPTGPNVIVCRL
jgi:hypothetical protein